MESPATADEADDSYQTLGVGRSLPRHSRCRQACTLSTACEVVHVHREEGVAGGLRMTGVWALAALWLGLALVASLLSIWFRISTALSEIVVGTIAQLIIGAAIGSAVLGTDEAWIKFLAGIGAIVLTFLAGAELDPLVFKLKWKEAAAIGLASFFFPFIGCAAAAHYLLGWEVMPSWLAGVAMSTGALAGWADSEAVLPAYLIGMVLAGTVGKDHALVRRLRTLTFGLLTPFYFIRAGSFVSIPALVAAPAAFIFFLIVKVATKIVGV